MNFDLTVQSQGCWDISLKVKHVNPRVAPEEKFMDNQNLMWFIIRKHASLQEMF